MDRPEPSGTLRTFLALPLCDSFLQEITAFRDRNLKAFDGVRWLEPAEIHITLHFFGTTVASGLPKIRNMAGPVTQGFRPLNLKLEGTGFFPNPQKPRVFWLGTAGDTEALARLQRTVTEDLQKEGFAVESRPFAPHATVGRIRHPDKFRIRQDVLFAPTPVRQIKRLVLYQSQLSSEGPHYEILESYPFAES